MKEKIILSLCLLLCGLSAECTTDLFPPLQPMHPLPPIGSNSFQNYTNNMTALANPFAPKTNINYPKVSQIEQKLFGKTYSNQDIAMRLSRIERSLFSTTYAHSTNEQRIDNIISNFNQINTYPNISQNVLSRMESRIFNQKYPENGSQRRIERLEQQIFGAVQSGNLEARYRALQLAAKNYNRNPYNIDPLDMNTSGYATNRGWKGLAGNLGNSLLGGTMTGFTPPINPFYGNGYTNGFNNYSNFPSGSGMYRGYRTNYGYLDDFSNFGSTTGVTILD
ncbi:MAG: hypothetical protein PHC64_03670 [Candidatus Gastranaerophilales bacterium]|nr:hypothetical protein [Candidatus Gastranaerophilales bacterium]